MRISASSSSEAHGNAIRPSALGKKNFLFIGHPNAGERSAVIYTLPGSCRRHGINSFDYLKELFTCLPAAKITQIKEFTPAAMAAGHIDERWAGGGESPPAYAQISKNVVDISRDT